METLIRRCAGLDVHKASVGACVRVIDENGELLSFTQSFGTTTSDLLNHDPPPRFGSRQSRARFPAPVRR